MHREKNNTLIHIINKILNDGLKIMDTGGRKSDSGDEAETGETQDRWTKKTNTTLTSMCRNPSKTTRGQH